MKFKKSIQIIIFSLFVNSVMGQAGKHIVEGNNTFALELFKELYKNDTNVFLSPYSISSILAMTYAGARNETENQMLKVLHYDSNQIRTHQGFSEINASFLKYKKDSLIKLHIANAIWKNDRFPINQDYLDLTKKYYSSSIFPLQGAGPINTWGKLHTNGKITEIVNDAALKDAAMVLTNAIYFKGDWLTEFDIKNTKKKTFTTLTGNEIDVEMMFQENEVNYCEDPINQVLELPYKGNNISMTIILPKKNNSLKTTIQNIDPELLSYYNTKFQKEKVKIFIPKFTFRSSIKLSSTLTKMGMPNAFDSRKADFSGISNNLSIGNIFQESFIQVDEKGSEAVAVTTVIMIHKSAPPAVKKDIIFKADRPFIILIKDKETNSILFIGSVVHPIINNAKKKATPFTRH
jgi:serpin B